MHKAISEDKLWWERCIPMPYQSQLPTGKKASTLYSTYIYSLGQYFSVKLCMCPSKVGTYRIHKWGM